MNRSKAAAAALCGLAALAARTAVAETLYVRADEGIAMAKAHGVYLDMDIYNGDYFAEVGSREGLPADMLRKNLETTDAQREGFRKAQKAGVKLTFGTDEGVYPFGKNARQFKYMVRYGMTPMQAIQAATLVSAELLGRPKDVGELIR